MHMHLELPGSWIVPMSDQCRSTAVQSCIFTHSWLLPNWHAGTWIMITVYDSLWLVWQAAVASGVKGGVQQQLVQQLSQPAAHR